MNIWHSLPSGKRRSGFQPDPDRLKACPPKPGPWLMDRLTVAVLALLIRSYQMVIAPLWVGSCRHWPTCSNYAIEALRIHGVVKGSRLAMGRLLRCRPGGTMGYDPVDQARANQEVRL